MNVKPFWLLYVENRAGVEELSQAKMVVEFDERYAPKHCPCLPHAVPVGQVRDPTRQITSGTMTQTVGQPASCFSTEVSEWT